MLAGLICRAGGAAADTGKELWPEIDVWVRIDPQLRVSSSVSLARNVETDYREGLLVLQADYSWKRHRHPLAWRRLVDEAEAARLFGFMLRGGVLGGRSLDDDGAAYSERSGFAELHVRTPLDGGVLMTSRVRTDLRFLGADRDVSWRLRYRLQAEKDFAALGTSVVPYASIEASLDSRYAAVNRFRAIGGATVALSRRFVAEANITYQHDSHLPNSNLVAVNAILNVYF